jgi:hypothetical protein
MAKAQTQTNAMENLAKVVVDVDKDHEDTRSAAKIKFQRTMRRLSILRRFAKRLGLEFDIENMEISMLTRGRNDGKKRKGQRNHYSQLNDLEQVLVDKRLDFENIANALRNDILIT